MPHSNLSSFVTFVEPHGVYQMNPTLRAWFESAIVSDEEFSITLHAKDGREYFLVNPRFLGMTEYTVSADDPMPDIEITLRFNDEELEKE